MKTYTIHRIVTEQDLAYILGSAIAGGQYGSFWMQAYGATANTIEIEGAKGQYFTEVAYKKPFGTKGSEYTEPVDRCIITLETIALALTKLFSDPKACGVSEGYQFPFENYDAGMADIVVQVATFGKLIYA